MKRQLLKFGMAIFPAILFFSNTVTAATVSWVGGSGSWTNAGTINETNATVNLCGTFVLTNLGVFNRSGGTVYLTGVLTNTGTLLVLDVTTTGFWVLNG